VFDVAAASKVESDLKRSAKIDTVHAHDECNQIAAFTAFMIEPLAAFRTLSNDCERASPAVADFIAR
jgi:hypothetical protein